MTTRRTYLPEISEQAATEELRKHLSAEQVYEIAMALEFVKGQTGHGSVTVEIKNGHPRFVRTEMSVELR